MAINLYERRYLKSKAYIRGHGIEIGAGASLQKLPDGSQAQYYDKRTRVELSEHFSESIGYDVNPYDDIPRHYPDGADFLIAHHVLEHTPDPIGTLREWHRYVRSDGTYVISVPYYALCPDRDRLVPEVEHLLFDHIFSRDGDSFESREHVLSFLCSWVDDSPGLAQLSKSECCKRIVGETRRGGHDFHWHAFDHELFRDLVYAAALFDDYVPEFYEPIERNEQVLDMLCVYRLVPFSQAADHYEVERVINKISGVARQVKSVLANLDTLSWNRER